MDSSGTTPSDRDSPSVSQLLPANHSNINAATLIGRPSSDRGFSSHSSIHAVSGPSSGCAGAAGGPSPDRPTAARPTTAYAGAGPSTGRNSNAGPSGSLAPISHRGAGSSQPQQQPIERLSRPMSFDKMEFLMREMQDAESGVPVRSQKTFLSSIPLAFMGYDLIEWLMERLSIEESEALSIANQLCLHGYFFPTNEYNKSLLVKDDSSLYRFQTPYYFPWQHRAPDNVEYAIFLLKRSLRNKQRHGLEEYESESLASLRQNLKAKWEFIQMQAQEQIRLSKDRKKGDKVIFDSQERAYWRIHRPPPAQFTPLEACPIPSRDRQGRPRRRTTDDWQREVDYLQLSMGRTRMNMSQACESLIQYSETFAEYDFFLQNVVPSNPWVTDDVSYWQLNHQIVDIPAERRVRRWAISIEELVSDPTGLQEFTAYLKKEYSHENIRFWIAVNELRRSAASQIIARVKEIYEEFLEPGAPCEINIDGKTMERVQHELRTPSRFTFDAAAEHIYALLLKKDCYPRFVRSEHYKALLATGIQQPHKKRFFGFGGATKKKSTTAQPASSSLLSQATSTSGTGVGPPPGALSRRRGSDRSLSGSAHELAVLGVRDASSSKVSHSHSQINLSDIPYSTVYRGDMPSAGFPILSATQEDPTSIINSACQTTTVTGAAVVVVSGSSVAPHQNPSATDTRSGASVDTIIDPPAALEVSAGAGASSSVCPWDDPPEPEPVLSSIQVSVCAPPADVPATSPATAKRTAKSRNHSAVESSSTAAIRDMSERLRKSCGLRQSTIDCEMVGPKRLEPIGKEQRRSSMSVTPRLSDHNWTQIMHQTASIDLPTEAANSQHQPPPMTTTSTDLAVDPVVHQLSRSSSTAADNDTLKTTVIPEDDVPAQSQGMPESPITSPPSPVPVPIADHPYATHDEVPNTQQTIPLARVSPRRPDELSVNDSKTANSTNVTPMAVTPTIYVVCPTGDDSVTNDEPNTTAIESDELGGVARPSDTRSALGADPDTMYALEELSPTTEEYREYCAPDDFQMEGEILAPGCVAPAPTPAPSIAPLAEVEGDPADDDLDPVDVDVMDTLHECPVVVAPFAIEPVVAIQSTTAAATPPKRHHRKKRTTPQSPCADGGCAVVPNAVETLADARQASEEIGTNMVCPWDDEEVTAEVEAPFVKTYATLGFL